VTYATSFDRIDIGHGRWEIRHRGTDQIAGQLLTNPTGFELLDRQDNDLGSFKTIAEALRALHGTSWYL
jgi:hypothetical protein